jgi:hypothetical protein
MSIEGKWRIIEMDLWDQEAIDLLGPAFINSRVNGASSGSLRLMGAWTAGTGGAGGPRSPAKAMTNVIGRVAAAG